MSDLPLYILVLVLLVPLSGFIAWAGDRIGHRIGKRRQSFLGLRPRHTATLFTIGAGIGIALVSFGLLLLSDARLRIVLSEGTRLLTQNKDLRTQNARLSSESKTLVAEIAEAQGAARAADAARTRAERARSDAEGRLRAAAAAEKRAQADLAEARTSLASARTDLGSARRRVAQAQERLTSAQAQVKAARGDLATARRLERVAREKFDGAQRSFNALADYQTELKEKLSAQERNLEIQTKDYAAQAARMQKALADQRLAYENETRRQKDDLEKLRSEIERLEARRNDMDRLLGLSLSSTTNLRRSPITYQVGEEVDRLAIPSDTNIWRVQTALENLLASAGQKAEIRGAGKGGGPRAVTLLPRRVPGETPASLPAGGETTPATTGGDGGGGGGEGGMPTEDDALRISAQAIRRANEEVVVILTAATNAVVGEPVPVTLRTYRNPVIFPEGATVSETTLNGSAERQAVADSVYSFLRQEVRQRLLEAGVIPASDGGNPGDDGDESVVNLSGSEWLKVLDDVRRAGPRARLTVKTARELRAADPVALRFEVKALPVPYPATASSK